jgi:hypothetical protein
VSTLEQRDLLPFGDLLRARVPPVMVGHLNVPGLTEQGVPATLPPNAYRYLRARRVGSAADDRLAVLGAMSIAMR